MRTKEDKEALRMAFGVGQQWRTEKAWETLSQMVPQALQKVAARLDDNGGPARTEWRDGSLDVKATNNYLHFKGHYLLYDDQLDFLQLTSSPIEEAVAFVTRAVMFLQLLIELEQTRDIEEEKERP